MPDWLKISLSSGADVTPLLLAWRFGAALGLGVAVAGLYRWARRGAAVEPTFVTTLVLLAALIAMATQIIGDNIARAFSLVGALSVVRFRTVVKDTQDTAFVILSVVMGMSSGANHLAVGLIGLAVLGLASPFLWPPGKGDDWRVAGGTLKLRVLRVEGVRASAERVMGASASLVAILSASTARKGQSLDLAYRVRLRPGVSPADLVAELSEMEGVEGVELEQAD